MTSPFDAYFPLPLKEKLEGKFRTNTSPFSYCKSKFQKLVTELKKRKHRNRFHFYFGDSLEVCSTNEELKNKMHVIHCSSNIVNVSGLANVLPIVSSCLTSEMPEAVLVTECNFFREEIKKPTLDQYVESELFCPLTMIPTVYGLKLLDHVRLGSSVCCTLHDHFVISVPITLKWNKAQFNYSNNIRLEVSPALKKFVSTLVDNCFILNNVSCFSPPVKDPFWTLFMQNHLLESRILRYTPLTFFNVIEPFFNRFNWVDGATKSLIEQCLPPPYRLALKSLQQWMNGEEVLLFYDSAIKNCMFADYTRTMAGLTSKSPIKFADVIFVLKTLDRNNEKNYQAGGKVDEYFFTNSHYVFNLNWKQSEEIALSFLLAKDHDLDSTTKFFIIDSRSKMIFHSSPLTYQLMQRQVVVNPNPQRFPRLAPYTSQDEFHCQESAEDYKLKVVKLQSSRGIFLTIISLVIYVNLLFLFF